MCVVCVCACVRVCVRVSPLGPTDQSPIVSDRVKKGKRQTDRERKTEMHTNLGGCEATVDNLEAVLEHLRVLLVETEGHTHTERERERENIWSSIDLGDHLRGLYPRKARKRERNREREEKDGWPTFLRRSERDNGEGEKNRNAHTPGWL